ncbi:hypothetical protein TNCV_2405971 [Trichonephila clavipes]|nr:hypothetical protein TNCV_2405971 [Trichonephila clavipes]
MQSLWSHKINWIDELSPERAKEWHRFLEDFNSISIICIGIVHPQATRVELHGFADASEFIANCRGEKMRGPLDVREINRTEITLIRIVQLQDFKRDIKSLKENNRVSAESLIKSLNPKSLAIRLLTFAERSFLTLADGAKYSFSSRGKSRLQISTLRSRVELTDSNCSLREVKADHLWLGTRKLAVLPISPRCHSEI